MRIQKKNWKLGIVILSDCEPSASEATINISLAQFLACPRLLVIGRRSLEQASRLPA